MLCKDWEPALECCSLHVMHVLLANFCAMFHTFSIGAKGCLANSFKSAAYSPKGGRVEFARFLPSLFLVVATGLSHCSVYLSAIAVCILWQFGSLFCVFCMIVYFQIAAILNYIVPTCWILVSNLQVKLQNCS